MQRFSEAAPLAKMVPALTECSECLQEHEQELAALQETAPPLVPRILANPILIPSRPIALNSTSYCIPLRPLPSHPVISCKSPVISIFRYPG